MRPVEQRFGADDASCGAVMGKRGASGVATGAGSSSTEPLGEGRQGTGRGIAEGAQGRQQCGQEDVAPLIGFALTHAELAPMHHLDGIRFGRFPSLPGPALYRARASEASQVLRRLSSCMPPLEDSGGPAPPCPDGGVRVAFGSVQTLGVRKAFSKLYQPFRVRGHPCGLQDTLSTLRPSCSPHIPPRLHLGRKTRCGWGATPYPTGTFTLQETPSLLGARTPGLSRYRKRERRTSGCWLPSPARRGLAGVPPHLGADNRGGAP